MYHIFTIWSSVSDQTWFTISFRGLDSEFEHLNLLPWNGMKYMNLKQEKSTHLQLKTSILHSKWRWLVYTSALNYPHLGASPDGLVVCACCGSGVLEIKVYQSECRSYTEVDSRLIWSWLRMVWSSLKFTNITIKSRDKWLFVTAATSYVGPLVEYIVNKLKEISFTFRTWSQSLTLSYMLYYPWLYTRQMTQMKKTANQTKTNFLLLPERRVWEHDSMWQSIM